MARKKTEEEREHELLLSNVREVLKSKSGRDTLWYILSQCGLHSDNFTGNSQTFYLEGKRAVGLFILQLLEDADPTAYPRLILEQQDIGVHDGPDDSDIGD